MLHHGKEKGASMLLKENWRAQEANNSTGEDASMCSSRPSTLSTNPIGSSVYWSHNKPSLILTSLTTGASWWQKNQRVPLHLSGWARQCLGMYSWWKKKWSTKFNKEHLRWKMSEFHITTAVIVAKILQMPIKLLRDKMEKFLSARSKTRDWFPPGQHQVTKGGTIASRGLKDEGLQIAIFTMHSTWWNILLKS